MKKIISEKIELKMITDGFGMLQRNGYDLICPFVPPMQVRQKVNSSILGGQSQEGIAIQKQICNTGCPLMRINDDSTVDVCCGGNVVTHKIENIIEVAEEPKADGKLINFQRPRGDA